jgi:hypothetical protein
MWLSGKFAVAGDLSRIFDFSAFSTAQAAFFGPGHCINYNRFFYPPTFLFFTYPFGYMPYYIALAAWIISLFAIYETAIYAVISRRVALILAATPVSVMFANVYLGHTGFLTAALFGLALVFMERRPLLSGIFLGLLTYKPHLGLLIPIALLASRNWRTLSSAGLTAMALAISAAIAFGFEGWTAFCDALLDRNSSLGPAPGVELRLQSIFGVLHWVGASTAMSWGGQFAVSVIVAIGIWMLWSKPISYNLKAAALCAGSLIVSPYILSYDLCVLSISVAFLVKDGLSRGFLPGERLAILICWCALFNSMVRSGPVICAVLLFFIIRRIVESRREILVRVQEPHSILQTQ